MKSLFLVCDKYGNVLEVASGGTFEEVYDETVGKNNGELLIDVNEEAIKEIIKEVGSKEVRKLIGKIALEKL